MEAHYKGKNNAGLVAVGILKNSDEKIGEKEIKDFVFKIEIPGLLSLLTSGNRNSYVPGIEDHVLGNQDKKIISVSEKIERGKYARNVLIDYKNARSANDTGKIEILNAVFKNKEFLEKYFRYFGYSSISQPEDVIPNVSVAFYSFHLMVILGFLFILIFFLALYFYYKGTLTVNKWFFMDRNLFNTSSVCSQ